MVGNFFHKFLPGMSHHAIDPISPCLTSASALTWGTAPPDNILLHLTITGYNTLPATNTTTDTHSNSKLDSTSFLGTDIGSWSFLTWRKQLYSWHRQVTWQIVSIKKTHSVHICTCVVYSTLTKFWKLAYYISNEVASNDLITIFYYDFHLVGLPQSPI